MIDASEIIPGLLYQGAMPPAGPMLSSLGVDVVLLCAAQYQPPPSSYPAVETLYCPMHDVESLDEGELAWAEQASSVAAARIRQGKRVLVTCMRGLNRSALVTALTLIKLGYRPEDAVSLIRQQRPGSLFNRAFVRYILGQR